MTSVLLCYQPTDGGVGRHIEDLAVGLCERGHQVTMCGPQAPHGLSANAAYDQLDLQRAITPRSDLVALSRLVRVLDDLKPDVVHAHSSKAGALVRLAKLSHMRMPVVYTPHGYAFAGHFSRSLERITYRSVERLLAPLADRVACVCEAEARLARSIGPAGRVRVIHNGVPSTQAGPVDERISELSRLGPVIGALTLFRPGKGLETLIDSFARVAARHPNAQLGLVGEGPDLEALRARARLRGVARAVHFLGASKEPLSALRGMDVFVLPSWAEAFPYVTLEAMSVGRAVVATDVGGVSEAFVDGESGLLVPPRDDAALAHALIGLLDEPDRRAAIGAAALAHVSTWFTRKAMIDRLAGVYDELVSLPSRLTSTADPRSELASSPSPSAAAGRS